MEVSNFVLILSVTLFSLTLTASASLIRVNTSNGDIIGSVEDVQVYAASGAPEVKQYRQFLGIPYAEPPIGQLRFKKPEPKTSWTVVHNGTFRRPMCFQGPGRLSTVAQSIQMVDSQMSEDCLTLDIYTPADGSGPFPVMIFLHGEIGASNGYVGDALAVTGDIIVVVINFRLSIFGFFSTGDDSSPGNYGLWDQHLAIEWVHDNIADFQGDPAKITVTGSSTGASHAIYQAMYEGNSGRFTRVIAQSGSPVVCPCRKSSSLRNPDPKAVAKEMGCEMETTSAILTDCLSEKSLSDIYDALVAMSTAISFTPVVDGEFILGKPKTVLESNDSATQGARDMFASVDMITGINDKEGGTHVVLIWSTLLDQEAESFDVSRTSFEDVVVPTAMDLVYRDNVSHAVERLVAYEYSELEEPDNAVVIRDKVVELSTDIDMAVPTLETVKLHANLSSKKTYLYEFAANTNITNPLTPSWLDGANHGDEIYFLFGFSRRTLDAWSQTAGYAPTETERMTSRRLINLWTNFMKTGDPNSPNAPDEEWPVFDPETSPFADISHVAMSSRKYFREPAMSFWTKVVPGLMDYTSGTRQPEDGLTDTMRSDESARLPVDPLLADNLIIMLIVMCACLICAYILLCLLAVSRNNSNQYSLKVV